MLVSDSPAIHLKFKILDRRPIEVPRQSITGRTAASDFIAKKRKEIMDGVDLRIGGVAPGKAQTLHTPFHFSQDELGFLAHGIRCRLTQAHRLALVT
jgi:hypothetical protein